MIKNIKGFIIAIITVLGLGIIAYFGYLFLNKYTNEKNITNFYGTYKIKNDSFKDYGFEILAKKEIVINEDNLRDASKQSVMSGFYNVITTDNNTILLAYFSELIETNTNLDITDNEEILTSKLCFELNENIFSQVQCPAVYNDQVLGYPLTNKKISYSKTK